MNNDQLEALIHLILGGVATFLIGKGYTDQSTATQVIGGLTALVTALLSYKTNTATAVALAAEQNAKAAAAKTTPTLPAGTATLLLFCLLAPVALLVGGCSSLSAPTPTQSATIQQDAKAAVMNLLTLDPKLRADVVTADNYFKQALAAQAVGAPFAMDKLATLINPTSKVYTTLNVFLQEDAPYLQAVESGVADALAATAPPSATSPAPSN